MKKQRRDALLLIVLGVLSVLPAPHDFTFALFVIPLGLAIMFSKKRIFMR